MRHVRPTLAIVLMAAVAVAACTQVDDSSILGPGGGTPTDNPGTTGSPTATPTPFLDYFEGLPTGATQRAALCARGNQDRFSNWYCGPNQPQITRLKDILEGIAVLDTANIGNTQFVFSGHSSSLVTQRTTSINPRALIFTPQGTTDYAAVGFVRGDHLAEIAAFDTAKQDINFFLVHYHKACDLGASVESCPNSERFTPDTETGWQNVDVYSDQDINNTPLDCLQCHEPLGVGTKRMLRMQERQTPWTHWFRSNRPSVALLNEFKAAHPNEEYAGIPAANISSSDPAKLEKLVEGAGFSFQPNEFNTSAIESEDQNNPPGPTWLAQYALSRAGEMSTSNYTGPVISTPYFMIDPYDPTALANASQAYAAWANGTAPASSVPNMVQGLFPSAELPHLGFLAATEATNGLAVMQHRCFTCHFGQFPGITRNRFDVHTVMNGTLSDVERQKVLERIVLNKTDRFRMPPLQFSELTQAQIMMIQTYLGAPATGAPGNDL